MPFTQPRGAMLSAMGPPRPRWTSNRLWAASCRALEPLTLALETLGPLFPAFPAAFCLQRQSCR